jgi:trehalose 6-phosphate phosphatase
MKLENENATSPRRGERPGGSGLEKGNETDGKPLPAPPPALLDEASLFLDFDGTLVEIAESPDAVEVSARLSRVMRRLLERLEGRVAVVSGRPAEQLWALLACPITIVGSHGLEFRGDLARLGAESRPPALAEALRAMRALANRRPGLLVEDKPLGVALHFRRLPEAEAECRALAADLAARHGLQGQPGKMMIEVRAPGGDKGTAIRTLMRESPFAGGTPVFMGDDLTDEPGFVAAAELGGAGILVGEVRPSAALYRLGGVEAALAWLEAGAAGIA